MQLDPNLAELGPNLIESGPHLCPDVVESSGHGLVQGGKPVEDIFVFHRSIQRHRDCLQIATA